ncbi:MAG: GNAT family N-acetyltransferase [Tepidisphaeraceae bacterium]|jgi:tagatose 1,6-diphosphate aldolase
MPFRLQTRLPFWSADSRTFQFFDPGRLIDNELELIPPGSQWIDAALAAAKHPTTVEQSPDLSEITRQQLSDFLSICPAGRQPGDSATGLSPCYHFWMHRRDTPDFPIAGSISLRIGNSYDTVMYYGHLGYHVYPMSRGRRFAQRACRLLLPLAARHGLNPLWITCNPENAASRRTCQLLGGKFVELVLVPMEHPLYQRGDKEKCRYRVDLPG